MKVHCIGREKLWTAVALVQYFFVPTEAKSNNGRKDNFPV